MSGIDLVLIGVALFGFLPLAIILYKQKRVRKILATGLVAKARVYNVYTPSRSAAEIVYYQFYNQEGGVSSGSLTTKTGLYKTGDVLDVYYLPDNPKRNTVHGAWQSKGLLIFGIVTAAFALFAAYKLWEMVKSGSYV